MHNLGGKLFFIVKGLPIWWPFFIYICNMNIKINEIEYPIFFGMTAIEKTMISLNCDSFEAMGDKLKSNLGMFQLHREVAYNGILAGCKLEGVAFPWKDSEEFGNSIDSFEQLTPAVAYFWEKFGGFFKTTG